MTFRTECFIYFIVEHYLALIYLPYVFHVHRNPMNYLLVNLAVADILYATFVAPKVLFKLTFAHPDGVIGNILCKLMTGGNVAWIGGASSIALLLAIAVERYYAVVYPQGNKGRLTKRKLKVINVFDIA